MYKQKSYVLSLNFIHKKTGPKGPVLIASTLSSYYENVTFEIVTVPR
jgi:hypothetical protein